MKQRLDHLHIAQWIDSGARVLDLGCGDGELLCHLRDSKRTRGIGVDMDSALLTRCLARGMQAVHTDIREDLSLFANSAFDYVILSQTLQSIDQPPQKLLGEMLRVGSTAIVSFPNFAYYPPAPANVGRQHAHRHLPPLRLARHPECALLHHRRL